MSVLVFLDETGDHSLDKIDADFPVFGVVMVVVDVRTYTDEIVPCVCRHKIEVFGHEGVVFHSYDIRRQKREFAFLTNKTARVDFFDRINQIMGLPYEIIGAFIRKQQHKLKYGANANNPYDLALEFAMERLLPLLEREDQHEVCVVAESRGENEDRALRETFYRFVSAGNWYVTAERVKKITFKLLFRSKQLNIIGMQMADLAAYPIARHVIDPTKPNPAYDLLEDKFFRGTGYVRGLKVFP